MAILKCKMCGGNLELNNTTVATCEYCGTQQTLPKLQDDVISNLFNRANNLRLKCEFDKAAQIYEKIIEQYTDEAEAYWGLVLCKYGIEYVEEPKTLNRIPTCHRTLYNAIVTDADYLSAIKHSDSAQKSIYEAEARKIDEIQKNILNIVKNEKPFDVFICYKETDENGKRTIDSTIANDIYYQLTQEGFKVFYAAITLEDKLGQEYEPYIFAALNSAKVMLVIGTKFDYFNAVWVKNEWSRFLNYMKTDRNKLLIPCYRDMDAYDLPEEFAHLQAQDMGKIGFINDVVRGIKKVLSKDEKPATVKETVTVESAPTNATPLLKRAFMFLEDGDWQKADEFCEQVLNLDPESALAYVGKLMAELKITTQEGLKDNPFPFHGNSNYQKAIRFADEKLKNELEEYIDFINIRKENERLESLYKEALDCFNLAISAQDYTNAKNLFAQIENYKDSAEFIKKSEENALESAYKNAVSLMKSAKNDYMFINASEAFKPIIDYKDSKELSEKCILMAEESRKDVIYDNAIIRGQQHSILVIKRAIEEFKTIPGWRDADEQIEILKDKIKQIEQAEIAALYAKKKKRKIGGIIAGIILAVIAIIIIFMILLNTLFMPNIKYHNAVDLMNEGKYTEAITAFEALEGHKDSADKIEECTYYNAINLAENGKYVEAYDTFIELGNYKDSKDKASSIYSNYKIEKCKYAKQGDYILFGMYEQDNNLTNGKEEIEWLVLDKTDTRILVISKYALDCKPYNTSYTNITWATCTLRNWLNNDFINDAFSDNEKAIIPTVTVSADKNPMYSTNPGNATQDNVFLLSINEANKYFSSDDTRQCGPTKYAVAQSAYKDPSGNCWWWLRSPGNFQNKATYVDIEGNVDEQGDRIHFSIYAVRPAMWIDITQ